MTAVIRAAYAQANIQALASLSGGARIRQKHAGLVADVLASTDADWIPFNVDDVILKAVHDAGGDEALREHQARAFMIAAENPWLLPIIEMSLSRMLKADAPLTVGGLWRFAPQVWSAMIKGGGAMTFTEGTRSEHRLQIAAPPPVLANNPIRLAAIAFSIAKSAELVHAQVSVTVEVQRDVFFLMHVEAPSKPT